MENHLTRLKLYFFYFVIIIGYLILPSIASAITGFSSGAVVTAFSQVVFIVLSFMMINRYRLNKFWHFEKLSGAKMPPLLLLLPAIFPIEADLLFMRVGDFSFQKLGISLITSSLTGITEEFVFRGVLLSGFLLVYQSKGIWKPIMISSFLFGAVHFLNLLSTTQVSPKLVILQVVYATFLGVFLASQFLVSKNLLLPIVTHTLIDLFSFVEHPLNGTQTVVFLLLYGIVPLIFGVYFLMRGKSK